MEKCPMSDLSNKISSFINELGDKHDWIKPKYEELTFLFNECQTISEAVLIHDLLDEFCMIDDNKRIEGYSDMATHIVKVANKALTKPLVVAMTKDTDPDSGQKVLHDLKTFLKDADMPKYNSLNQMLSLSPKKHKDVDTIIVVDEFIGSGKTVRGRHNFIKERLQNIKQIYFCVLSGMESSVKQLQEEGIEVYCHKTLKKGITDNSKNLIERIFKMLAMGNMENRLRQRIGIKGIDEFCFGYGQAEALLAFGRYNIPNSVFPIFWWPENQNEKRKTMFTRVEDGLD